MKNSHRSQDQLRQWMGYTDVLASSFLILVLVTVVSSLNNANNQKPPLINLTEAKSFSFVTGSYSLSDEFKRRLDGLMAQISENVDKYRIDTIEVIGHTDGQPSSGFSNLDERLQEASGSRESASSLSIGSNADLGLMRALSVASYVKAGLKGKVIQMPAIIPYSASSLIDLKGQFRPASLRSDDKRRRIEIRFTRSQL